MNDMYCYRTFLKKKYRFGNKMFQDVYNHDQKIVQVKTCNYLFGR